MRFPAALGERDANHAQLAQLYEDLGCTVTDTSMIGFGVPDAIVGATSANGRWMAWVEFKTEHGRPTKSQERYIRDWRGPPVKIIRDADDVIEHVQEQSK